jgi:branched-chain amino acid transport system permease protein
VSAAWQLYISTVLIYLAVDIIACWGLNFQFGYAGLVNFAFIVFQSAGAYTAAVLTIGPAKPVQAGGFQFYIGGAHLPFPLPILAGGAVGAALALVIGPIGLRRLRSDYQAMVMLVTSLIATSIATNAVGLVNGPNGLALVPKPLAGLVHLSPLGYQWFYAGLCFAFAAAVYFFVHRLTGAPLGRSLRAVRDSEAAAVALGKNPLALRMIAFTIGGAIAGISGALLVGFVSAWSPASWLYQETFVYFAALIIGGAGNNLGAAVGAALVPVSFLEAARFLPQFGYPGLVETLQWIVVGLLTLIFLWFRPRGIFPERRRRYPRTSAKTPVGRAGALGHES